ncbi:protein kinase domain-containing protein [Candidatus Berkiella aquae]|uniref:Protein kinase domain protein n=1 Tax=Candidatus Berkiella aquae TaxID=295108 RepID=A0A0Q9YXD8_9GAMM|nr:protein kinase family protein [Candidatus Berkiella aquae]MCS5711284.1 hypothetical protein [Candidatus Berkiella aquae]
MITSPKTNARAEELAKSKGYTLEHSKIINADNTYKTNMGTMAHAKRCPLGEGQNASIFLAQNLTTGEFLAVKKYDKSRAKESYHVDDTKQIEIEQTVLNILDMNRGTYKVNANELHVYMPYIDGVDLEKAKANEIGDFSDALRYAQLATEKLLKLHKANFIHADLHAGNVMICPQSKMLHFVDFEKCKYMEPETQELEIWGKPNFLPQRAYDKARPKNTSGGDPMIVPVNKETDRYGLGMTLYTMFSKVLGEGTLSIDNDGKIELKKIPNGMSKDTLNELVNNLHTLTRPGSGDLENIASVFKALKNSHAFQPLMQNNYLPSSIGSKTPSPQTVSNQQIIGTQAIGAKYHFTNDDPVIEQAKLMLEMGSKIVKFSVDDKKQLEKLQEMPFSTYFMWWRSDSNKVNLSENDKKAEYDATYNFVKELLLKNAKDEKTFYIGHWEGDWYLLPDYDASKNPSPERIQGMIDWLNVRQKAVDDARRDFGSKSLSKVYHYTEVNRVRDAMDKGMNRLVNSVIPKTNVDCVSYSSYDVQYESQNTINKSIKYIEEKLLPKPGINGPRVFVGEFGAPARDVNFDPIKHEEVNRKIAVKFLKSGVPYILYWQMYNNEIEKNQQAGFWLVNDKNQKQPLYNTFKGLYKAQEGFKNVREQSISWLENMEYGKKEKMRM